MREFLVAILRVLQRIAEPPDILQVHIGNGEYFQVAQKRFERSASAGEKLAWASEMVELAQMRDAKMLGLYRREEREFVRVARPVGHTFDPIFLVDLGAV